MSGILELLNSDLGKQIISGVSGQTGAPADKTAGVLGMALPALMSAMQNNAGSEKGASGLLNALSSKHDGSILDDLGGLFSGGVDDAVMQDGQGILGHVLGAKQPAMETALSQKSGLESGTVSQILKVAAPILMGFLGKQSRAQNVSSSNGIGDLLGGLLGGANQGTGGGSILESLLDADGDGSVIDDIANIALGGKKKGGLGGLLGGLFGK